MHRPFEWRLAFCAGLASAVWIGWLLPHPPVSGDAFAVYFPTVWRLQDGDGLSSFLALQHGSYRTPGYAVLLWLVTLTGASELQAALVVTLLSMFAVGMLLLRFLSIEIGRPASCLAILFFLASPCFFQGVFSATPDLPCFAAVIGALVLARDDRFVLAGLLSGIAVLFRFNAIFLPVFLLIVARDHRRHVALGVLASFLPWMAVSFIVKRRLFWLASSHASVGFHPQFLARHNFPEELLAEAPFEFVWRAAYRGLIGGPIEIGSLACLAPVALAALFAIPAIWRAPADRVKRWMLLMLLSWITIAPIHFEARYYPLQVLAISMLAAHVLARTRALALASAVAAIALSIGSTQQLAAGLSADHAFRAEVSSFARSPLPDGCITADEDTYRYSAFRLAFREAGRADRICYGRDSRGASASATLTPSGTLSVTSTSTR